RSHSRRDRLNLDRVAVWLHPAEPLDLARGRRGVYGASLSHAEGAGPHDESRAGEGVAPAQESISDTHESLWSRSLEVDGFGRAPATGAVRTHAGGRRFPASESWVRRQRDSTFARLDYGPRSRAADRPPFVPAPRPQPPEARMSLTIRRKSILAVAALALAAPVAAQNPIAPMKGIGQKLGKGL